jgi:CRISPR type III-A-associated protein Csm2
MIELKSILEKSIKAVSNVKQFKNFSNFFEGILAYHKAHGGN